MTVPAGQNKKFLMQDSAVAIGDGTVMKCTQQNEGGFSVLGVQVEGISGDTITFEATIDDSTWYGVVFTNLNDNSEATTATADGLYRADVSGLSQVRSRISTYSAGTIIVTGQLVA